MFEGSLVESQGLVVSGTKRWTALGSVVFQCGLAGVLVAIPLLHPDILPVHLDPPRLVAPISRPPMPPVRVEASSASLATAMSLPTMSTGPVSSVRALLIRPGIETGPEPTGVTGPSMATGTLSSGLAEIVTGTTPNVSAVPTKKSGPVSVSSGVVTGMLMTPIQPVYPSIARMTRVEGAVVMEAVISKTGRIESLHVVSGHPMLRQAAMDAVEAARYQPYKLNGEAIEVQTTITVNFRLGS